MKLIFSVITVVALLFGGAFALPYIPTPHNVSIPTPEENLRVYSAQILLAPDAPRTVTAVRIVNGGDEPVTITGVTINHNGKCAATVERIDFLLRDIANPSKSSSPLDIYNNILSAVLLNVIKQQTPALPAELDTGEVLQFVNLCDGEIVVVELDTNYGKRTWRFGPQS